MIRLLVCLILVWVVAEDLTRFRIRNSVVAGLLLCFVLDCLLRSRTALLLPHAGFAALGLGLLVGLFALRGLGGGDVKLLSAALFWVGLEGCLVFAILMLACTLLYVIGAWLRWLPARRVGRRIVIPFGPSIALAWMAQIGLNALL